MAAKSGGGGSRKDAGGPGGGQRQADQAAAMGRHEVDRAGRAHLRRDDQVAFVLAVLVVDEDEHAPVPRVLDDLFGRRDGGGQVEDVGSEVGHNGSAGLSAAALDKAASLGQSGRAVLD